MHSLIRETIQNFCLEFIEDPYLCYTEHGQHALFFERLYKAMPSDLRYAQWENKRLCVIQKEYPTASNLGKATRQHWDIAVVKSPPESVGEKNAYDYLQLDAVIEFGMNEAIEHLEDDVDRISHQESNVEYGFVVHLHRLSSPGEHISGRDWSPKSQRIVRLEDLHPLVVGQPLEIHYAMSDQTGTFENGLWVVTQDGISGKYEDSARI